MIPVLCALLRCLSDSMSLQKLFVCYHLPSRDEQELSLGMLIHCKRIYNFLMLHACFVYDPTCFMCLFIQYLAFLRTNLLTRCHSASSYFLLFLYFRKIVQEIFTELHGTNCQYHIIT